jgi:hypothetical protein
MSEVIDQSNSPERTVFGEAFSFASGRADDGTVKSFFEERVGAIKEGSKAWLPRTLDADSGVTADLFKDGHVAATLVFEYEDMAASVYTTSPGGAFGDTALCDRVAFDVAVETAEQSVS